MKKVLVYVLVLAWMFLHSSCKKNEENFVSNITVSGAISDLPAGNELAVVAKVYYWAGEELLGKIISICAVEGDRFSIDLNPLPGEYLRNIFGDMPENIDITQKPLGNFVQFELYNGDRCVDIIIPVKIFQTDRYINVAEANMLYLDNDTRIRGSYQTTTRQYNYIADYNRGWNWVCNDIKVDLFYHKYFQNITITSTILNEPSWVLFENIQSILNEH